MRTEHQQLRPQRPLDDIEISRAQNAAMVRLEIRFSAKTG